MNQKKTGRVAQGYERRQVRLDSGSCAHYMLKHGKTAIALSVILVIGLSLCSYDWNLPDTAIPAGYITKEEHFDPSGWQDFTDYCKYQYGSVLPFEKDARYHIVSDDEVAEIIGYHENFSGWMRIDHRLDEFDFDPACINAGDYCLIDDMEGRPIGESSYAKFENYHLYYFDRETLTLYYMHNNI